MSGSCYILVHEKNVSDAMQACNDYDVKDVSIYCGGNDKIIYGLTSKLIQ